MSSQLKTPTTSPANRSAKTSGFSGATRASQDYKGSDDIERRIVTNRSTAPTMTGTTEHQDFASYAPVDAPRDIANRQQALKPSKDTPLVPSMQPPTRIDHQLLLVQEEEEKKLSANKASSKMTGRYEEEEVRQQMESNDSQYQVRQNQRRAWWKRNRGSRGAPSSNRIDQQRNPPPDARRNQQQQQQHYETESQIRNVRSRDLAQARDEESIRPGAVAVPGFMWRESSGSGDGNNEPEPGTTTASEEVQNGTVVANAITTDDMRNELRNELRSEIRNEIQAEAVTAKVVSAEKKFWKRKSFLIVLGFLILLAAIGGIVGGVVASQGNGSAFPSSASETETPTSLPRQAATRPPSPLPTVFPTTRQPLFSPTWTPTASPDPTLYPTLSTISPMPSPAPSIAPTREPSVEPTLEEQSSATGKFRQSFDIDPPLPLNSSQQVDFENVMKSYTKNITPRDDPTDGRIISLSQVLGSVAVETRRRVLKIKQDVGVFAALRRMLRVTQDRALQEFLVEVEYEMTYLSNHSNVSSIPADFGDFVNNNLELVTQDLRARDINVQESFLARAVIEPTEGY